MFTMVRIQGMANERRHETLRNKLQGWFKSEHVFFWSMILCLPTSKGGSIGSMPACGPRYPSSNPTWGKLV